MDRLTDQRVYIETYGCTYNHADTLRLAGILRNQGCTIVSDLGSADAVVINTCTVIGWTERHMLRRIRACAGRTLYVTGCMPVVQREEILAAAPDARVILPDEIERRFCGRCTKGKDGIGIVQVAAGCAGRCAYCITRFARGPLRSRSMNDICREVGVLAEEGACEVQFTAQDVSAWGMDTGEALPDLVRAASAVPGNFRVRLGMMNPATVKRILVPLAEACRDEKVFSFLHLPVQSGSDAVLAGMARGYTVAEYEGMVATFREICPDVRICTDFIVGYPTETEEDFAGTLALLRRVRPEKVNVTRYSPRPGTAAAALKAQPERIAKERSRLLDAAAKAIYAEQNAGLVGTTVEALVTARKKGGSWVARDRAYREIVVPGDFRPGEWLSVEITGNRTVYLTGVPKDTIRVPTTRL
ncbi:MAG: tRNA (N(6)-L-threonylcarbamoyladenosine(37)-C(2))-methylthiotransferase [Methanofollis sp.]|uniref:tRNA (N(6)-L-threonylcarbamoyladenosine(37)-C(2))- methylthiotransferase n=1 Tax=Methanofollis sp. TaxID=2052835 RepID=UPI00261326C9|nr:tRNA (N(6)-L-threonylcarbamoyladenosine(37)-C(2))-methylthiotransferase [Methanofollis sp.]MDD4254597.1 tRNA (N(6)-L-threonylcarbamoyladenosine(37)-C(2))-methylthiotransferase [Methanofollis sp.]